MNNPLMQMVQVARTGGSPMALMQQLARNDPRASMAMQMMNGKGPQQLKQMCENMCRERGTSVEQVAQSLGLPMPGGK